MKILTNTITEFTALKEAQSAKQFIRKQLCHWCGSELEYNEKDIKTVPAKLVDRDETIPAQGFYCPVCNGINITG